MNLKLKLILHFILTQLQFLIRTIKHMIYTFFIGLSFCAAIILVAALCAPTLTPNKIGTFFHNAIVLKGYAECLK